MRVFFVTHRTPWPPFKGSQVRPFNVIKALAEHGHEVLLFSFANEGQPEEARRELGRWCSSVTLAPFSTPLALARTGMSVLAGGSLSESWFGSGRLRSGIVRHSAERPPDAFFVYSSSMAQYVPRHLRGRSVCDIGDVDSKKWADLALKTPLPRSLAYAIEGRRLRTLEYRIVRDFAYTNLATEKEAELLTELTAEERRKLVSVTNGTDLEYFRPDAWTQADLERLPANERRFFSASRNRLCFTGAMDYAPNAEAAMFFAREVLPRVRDEVPDAEFLVVGSNPTREVRSLENEPGVHVTGFVQDARPYFNQSVVYVAPLLMARGVQNKVLEAMACGCAIVTTPTVAEGVGATHGDQLLTADSADEMSAHVLRLLRSVEDRRRLSSAARLFVEKNFAWPPLMDRLLGYVERAAAGPQTSSNHS